MLTINMESVKIYDFCLLSTGFNIVKLLFKRNIVVFIVFYLIFIVVCNNGSEGGRAEEGLIHNLNKPKQCLTIYLLHEIVHNRLLR